MARSKTIDYERVTLSLPKKLVLDLRTKVGKNKMSSFVAKATEKELKIREETLEEFRDSLQELANKNSSNIKTQKSSLEILREIRYEGKY